MDDLVVTQGETGLFDIGPVSREDPDTGTEVPVDLTQANVSLWFYVKRRFSDPDANAAIKATYKTSPTLVEDGIHVYPSVGDNNTGLVTVAADDTAVLAVGRYQWSLVLKEPSNRVTVVDGGSFYVEPAIVQNTA